MTAPSSPGFARGDDRRADQVAEQGDELDGIPKTKAKVPDRADEARKTTGWIRAS
jgi:hypothetical protein